MNASDAEALAEVLVEWSGRQPSCRGLAVVGSWARGEGRYGSDLDVLCIVDDVEGWTRDPGWLRLLLSSRGYDATPPEVERHGRATSLRTRPSYRSELELTFAPPGWAATDPCDPGTLGILRGGVRVLLDPDGLLARLIAVAGATRPAGVDGGLDGT